MRNAHKTLYLDGKKCAIPSLHRDIFLAKVPGLCPDAASGNTTSPYCRAVRGHRYRKQTDMKKSKLALTFLLFFQLGYSQTTKGTITIYCESPWTIDKMNFRCIIQNISNKTIKIIPFSEGCNDVFRSIFWDINIQRDTVDYSLDPDSIILVLGQPSWGEHTKIRPHSKYEFIFCIDFSNLTAIKRNINTQMYSSIIETRKNTNFGTYSVQLEYIPSYKITEQAGLLRSNKESIIYKK